ncbi:unnamed protein product, partial [Mesorhabditis belari]|uniref:Uncharacterized protein n=1 Tax=Mesorhabditis belari TaxID=2138241 RepID=A0AAF3EU25_9BILA
MKDLEPIFKCKNDAIDAQVEKACGKVEMNDEKVPCQEVVKNTKCRSIEYGKVCKVANIEQMTGKLLNFWSKMPEFARCEAELVAAFPK